MTKILLALAVLAAPAAAADKDWTLGARAGGAFFAGAKAVTDQVTEPAPAFGGFIRRRLCPVSDIGASYDYIQTASKLRVQPLLVNLGLRKALAEGWTGRLQAGIGSVHVRELRTVSGPYDTLGLGLGAGFEYAKGLWTGGFDLRYIFASKESNNRRDIHILSPGFWFGLRFGDTAAPAAVAKAAPAAAAAPAPAPAPAPKPADEDSDGVADSADRCPGTPKGTAVSVFGCPVGQALSINLTVEFDTSKSEVKPAYDAELKKVADFLAQFPTATAEIEGHTDSVGDAAANMSLSQSRADAVRQALIDRFKADGARLTAKGYGETKPLASNDDEAGRQRNRRVVATFNAK